MPRTGRLASPFIVEGEGGLQARRAKREKEKKKKEKKRNGWSTMSFLFFSSRASLVVWAMETSVISGFCSLLEQRASSVNPDDAPHPVTGVGGVK
jgi:hypothetical protein